MIAGKEDPGAGNASDQGAGGQPHDCVRAIQALRQVRRGVEFPWVICVSAGFLAMLVALKATRPGVPLKEIIGKDQLSIR